MTYPTQLHQTKPPQPQALHTRSTRKLASLPYFFIRHQGRYLKIRTADIDYIESQKNYAKIVTKHGAYLTIVTLKRLESILPAGDFCRIHHAYIVALEWITSFDRYTIYGAGQQLPIGDTYRQRLLDHVMVVTEESRSGPRNDPRQCLRDVPQRPD